MLTALAKARTGVDSPQTPSIHRLRRGLPGYLIQFAPHAVVHECQPMPSRLVSPLVFLPISTHFTTTPAIPPTSASLEHGCLSSPPAVKRRAFRPHIPHHLRTLYAQSIRTTLAPSVLPRLLAQSEPGLLRVVPSLSSHPKGVYNPKAVILHAALLPQACAHWGKFLAAASRRSLGRVSVPVWLVVLTDQRPVTGLVGRYPANHLMGRTPHLARRSFPPRSVCGISIAFAVLSPTRGQVRTCYSAVRHSAPEGAACDLHALGTPPAFVLSQDQTLHYFFGRLPPTGPVAECYARFSCEGAGTRLAIKNQGGRGTTLPTPGAVADGPRVNACADWQV